MRRRSGVLAVLAAIALLLSALLSTAPGWAQPDAAPTPAPIADELARQVEAEAGGPVSALLMLPNAQGLTGSRQQVLDRLREHAEQTQAEVVTALEQTEATVLNRFWITNMVLVEFPASAQTLGALAELPGVRSVLPNFTLSLPEPAAGSPAVIQDELAWGVEKIQAGRVWDELGVNGSGVRVATLDTGVDITHPDLAGKMVTDDPSDPNYPGGWLEFNSAGAPVASAPHDSQYHGTHVSGTIQGSATSGVAIGVAPGAQLMHGLVIPGGSGSFAQVVAGMQWAIAPTDAAGNPAGQPADVVNMSLGANGFHEEMIAPTQAMRAAGTFPAFAIGNNCGTSGTASPGNVFEAVSVGATDNADNVASFSCGAVVRKDQWAGPPASWPDTYVKPDVSAPGVDVYSASPGGGYRTLSGTSMATPHTAGTVALMLSAAPGLPVADVLGVLGDTAFWDNRYAPAPPDTRLGIGRINAFDATTLVAVDSGIEGAVTDAASGQPVDGATITIDPGDRSLTSGDDGRFSVRVVPGSYTVEASRFGYQSSSVTVEVTEGGFATADLRLTPVPSGSITGVATLDESGHGIPGVTVRVLGVPVDLSAVTGVDGRYTIDGVPAGGYEVAATAPQFAAPPPAQVTVTAGQAVTADFAFSPPPETIAVVDSSATRAQEYADLVFTPRGIGTAIYNWTQLAQAAQHKTVVLGYGLSTNYNAANFQAFLDATDASGAGVIFTDHAFGTHSGLKQLSIHTGQPVSTGTSSSDSPVSAESYYEVTAEHPMLAGYQVGDRIVIDNSTQAKWVAWFNGYSGEGRQTIGNLGRTRDGIRGGGIGVDQRANNRHVLLSTHGTSATRGPADWTEAATQLFMNAIAWASPPPVPNRPYFALHDLRVEPDVVRVDQPVTVSAGIKNVGGSTGSYSVVLQVRGQPVQTTPVELDAGQASRVQWTLAYDQLGSYEVRVEHMTDSFRVRAPIVSLSASTVDAPATSTSTATVGPLAGATVELIAGGTLRPIGRTDDQGRIDFEIPDPTGTYTVVIRRPATDEGGPAYLLHRQVTIIDDGELRFAPRVLPSAPETASIGSDLSARVDLDLDNADARHGGMVFVRPASTAPYGFQFAPGSLVATLDHYEALTVHEVSHLEQDWWLPSRVLTGVEWVDPLDVSFRFGGAPRVELADTTAGEGGAVTVDWRVTDGYGHPFATVLATDVRPFVALPDVVELEQVEGLLRAAVPNELKPVLRLFDPDGVPVRAGSINWNAQPYQFTLAPGTPDGRYRLVLESSTGGYGGTVSAHAPLQVGPPAPRATLSDTTPASAPLGEAMVYDVRVGNNGSPAPRQPTWQFPLSRARGCTDDRDRLLRLRVGDEWRRINLRPDGTGALAGTVTDGFTLAVDAGREWTVSLEIRREAGDYTITDRVTGAGVDVANTDTIALARARGGALVGTAMDAG